MDNRRDVPVPPRLTKPTAVPSARQPLVDMLHRLKANTPRPTDGDTKSQGLLVAGEFPVLVGAYLQRLIMMNGKPWGFVPFKEVWSNVPLDCGEPLSNELSVAVTVCELTPAHVQWTVSPTLIVTDAGM